MLPIYSRKLRMRELMCQKCFHQFFVLLRIWPIMLTELVQVWITIGREKEGLIDTCVPLGGTLVWVIGSADTISDAFLYLSQAEYDKDLKARMAAKIREQELTAEQRAAKHGKFVLHLPPTFQRRSKKGRGVILCVLMKWKTVDVCTVILMFNVRCD